MKKRPLVSVIVPTYNSAKFLGKCLRSIKNQTYPNIELIVVDNSSTDNTKEVARRFTKIVFNRGSERSAQRNFGARESKGKYLVFIDSDMQLSKDVVKDCAERTTQEKNVKALVIPEKSFGKGFWARCKRLEKSFYVGVDWMEAARFFEKKIFLTVGGYDEKLISGEDWDLSQRIEKKCAIDRVDKFIFHNERETNLARTIWKKFYYSRHFAGYVKKGCNKGKVKRQTGIMMRYKLFLTSPTKLLKDPLVGIGMLLMKTCELGFGGVGYLVGRYL